MIAGGARRATGTTSRAEDRSPAGADRPVRRPWWVWTVPFAAVLGVLLVRNAFLFSTPLYEDADMGANSILIEQARRFTLLVGHYSRAKFNHPGPAFLYVQSWGESLFWGALHLVPTAWNGQLIAVYALNALFAALVVGTGYGVARSVRTAAACAAVLLAMAAVRPAALSSDWMPYLLVMGYIAFLVAIASVAAGRIQDSWIAALAGWFLINGNVAFLLFVPLAACACLAALCWSHRRSLRAAALSLLARPAVWVPVVIISAVLAFPIVLNTLLHWPGEFGKYLAYSPHPAQPGTRGPRQVADYMLWFWWPGAASVGWLVPAAAYLVAALLTWRLPAGPVRRFCVSLLAFDTLSSVAFACYAAAGIDELPTGHYIGYFYWSAPVIMLLVMALGVLEAPPLAGRWGLGAAVIAAVTACAAFAVAPQTRVSTDHVDPVIAASGPDTDPALPSGVARMAALAGARPIVLRVQHDAWPAMTGVLVQAERTGVRACVADPYWEFMITSQFVCTPAELANGDKFGLYVPGQVPRGMRVVFRLRRALVTSTGK